MKLQRTPVEQLAFGALCLAFGAFALWNWAAKLPFDNFLQEWMPHIGTAFAIIALTLVLFEPIKERQEKWREKQRWLPQTKETLWEIGDALAYLAEAAEWDYTQTHDRNYVEPHKGVTERLAHWKDGLRTGDNARENLDDLIDAATLLSTERAEKGVRQLDAPELTVAMGNFVRFAEVVGKYGRLFTSPDGRVKSWLAGSGRRFLTRDLELLAGSAHTLAEAYYRTAAHFPDPLRMRRYPRDLESTMRRQALIGKLTILKLERTKFYEEFRRRSRRIADLTRELQDAILEIGPDPPSGSDEARTKAAIEAVLKDQSGKLC